MTYYIVLVVLSLSLSPRQGGKCCAKMYSENKNVNIVKFKVLFYGMDVAHLLYAYTGTNRKLTAAFYKAYGWLRKEYLVLQTITPEV